MLRKSITEKIVNYVSSPRKGTWISARSLAKYIREPLERVEFYLCDLTDSHVLQAVKDVETGKYWLLHPWQKAKATRKSPCS